MNTINEWADFWRYQIGVNVIPADTKNKTTWIKWSDYQDRPISLEMHEHWKRIDRFKDGMAIILGKVWHNPDKKGLFLNFIDLDNKKAIEEFCTRDGVTTPLEELAKHMIVEQHKDDLNRAHIYCYSTRPFAKKSSDSVKSADSPAIEVKGLGSHGIAYCSPSPHKNGSNYEITGNFEPETLDVLEGHIDSICKKCGIPYLSNGHSSTNKAIDLFNSNKKVYKDHNRHGALLTEMCSLIKRLHSILPEETIRDLAIKENERLCEPPLDEREFEKRWKCAVKFIQRVATNEEREQQREQKGQGQAQNEKNDNENQRQQHSKVLSVLEAKRKHQGTWRIIGKIVTVSDMYVIEVMPNPPDTQILYKDAKSIQLEDIEKLDENERLDIILYDDDITNVIPGEIVEITGDSVLVSKNSKKNMIKNVLVNTSSIKYVNRKELVISAKDIESFEKFAFYPKILERLVSMFAPNVIGHHDVRLGVIRSIVGGDNHGQRGGGRVNTFMVGDPGTAKSTIAEEATKIKLNSRFVSAPHASSKTITAIAEKENETVSLKLGAIPLSRNAICAIDEITAFQPEEQGRLLDVLERGRFPLDKHGRHWEIPAPTTIIATANPINSKWIDKKIASNDEINMIKTLLDRFQQIYAFRDNMEEEQIDGFLSRMSAIRKRKPHNYNYLAKYLIYASAIKVRKNTPEAENMLNEFWKAAKLKDRLSIRMYFGLFSIAEAQAKLHLKDTIDEEIATQAMQSIQLMMIQYGETIKEVVTPKIVTYKKFLEILENNKVGVDVRELCKTACKEDKQIAAYLGDNWSIAGNKGLQVIVGMLRNHSQVKETKSKPVVLQWIGPVSDLSDLSDLSYQDQESQELVSVDKREQNTPNQDDFQNEMRSHMSHRSDSNKKPPVMVTCPTCPYTTDAYTMKFHHCEGGKTI